MRFSVHVLVSLLLGVAVGRVYGPDFGNLYEIMLYALILLVGIDIGQSFKPEELGKLGGTALKLPFATLAGSLLGGLAASLLLGIELRWGLAISAGCGWYSLTGPLIGRYSPTYGTLGFLANLIRELLTVLFYPIVIRIIPGELAVSMGGATTMDTTLPVMAMFGGRDVALVAFVHGFVLTAVVPFLIPLFLSL
ncbi:lysine exporter LysO family protein [Thermococcus sp.]|uniref:lysine exporter LysO family protein n=1 Tax=Thermococcus sp. TaxID=35749 RepID=UPI00262BA2DC|nr:lysine exporter LysO family protein [Thermococcus sp.]